MKQKRYKLERKIIEEVHETLKSYLIRTRQLLCFIEPENNKEQYISNLLILYGSSILNYMNELDKLLIENGNYYLVTAELVEKLNKHQKNLNDLEDHFHANSKYSLKVH